MTLEQQRDQAIYILNEDLSNLSVLYKECFLSMGRGALLVYAKTIIDGIFPGKIDYRTKKQMLDVFDKPSDHADLKKMIDNYNPKKEGIMTLITDYSNATYYITVNLK
ncbi:MAG: hypothetical protein OEM02_00745 [Desulfobulbaceae bacterium]|nr:hypothetical protein [Desulfobulbaceae bacterium]